MAQRVLIAAVTASFFRCGRQWTSAGVIVAQDEFTEAQWDVLAAEPRLHIRPAPEASELTAALSEALAERIKAEIGSLEGDDFGKDGKPKLEALKARLPEHKAEITAALRDEVWQSLLPQT